MAEKTIGHNATKVYSSGTHSALIGGDVVSGIPDETVFVASQSELTNFSGKPTGTMAMKYDLSALWVKKPDGTWETV